MLFAGATETNNSSRSLKAYVARMQHRSNTNIAEANPSPYPSSAPQYDRAALAESNLAASTVPRCSARLRMISTRQRGIVRNLTVECGDRDFLDTNPEPLVRGCERLVFL
jgi:hypothetical protein